MIKNLYFIDVFSNFKSYFEFLKNCNSIIPNFNIVMKKSKTYIFFLITAFFMLGISMPSCKSGEGCANQNQYKVKTDKNGNMTSKRGKSTLFSKKQKKKKRKKS